MQRRVVDDVAESDVEQHGIDQDRRQVIGDPDRRTGRVGVRGVGKQRRLDEIGQVVRSQVGPERASLDPAHVQQAAHEAAETLRLGIDGPGRRPHGPGLGHRLRGGVSEAARERSDAGDGRAEIVRHGIEDGAAQRITLARHLGRGELGTELVAAERDAQLVRGERQQPSCPATRLWIAGLPRGVDPSGIASVGTDRRDVVLRAVIVRGLTLGT